MPQTLGEAVDQIVTIPMRVGTQLLERERLRHLYEEARARQGNVPLAMEAARRLKSVAGPGDCVFLLTGLGECPWFPVGEMDGPPGLVSLARAITYGLRAMPLYLTEPLTLPTCTVPSRAIGVPVYDSDVVREFGVWMSAGAIALPLGKKGAEELAVELLDRFRPKALIACEKLGPNSNDEFAAIDGQMPGEICDWVSHLLFEEARRRDILTIGIGDVGNELGLGVIEDIANAYNGPNPPFRQGGNGTRIRADIGIVATCSNWGAYGISACLAYLTGNLAALHDATMEEAMLEACAAMGSVDFTAGVPINYVDGRPLEVNQAIVTLLRQVVKGRLMERPPSWSFLPKEFTKMANKWRDYRAQKINGVPHRS